MVCSSRIDISYEYFEWLLYKIRFYEEDKLDYRLLMRKLYSMEFVWSVDNDCNRAADGMALRDEFCDEEMGCWYDFRKPCSVLEMLIALAIICENNIMGEPDNERPSRWFWIMIDNLGLSICTDDIYDEGYVEQQVDKWLDRDYSRNGKGGLFPVKRSKEDQRKVEIWYQMQAFLNENYSYI